MTGEPTPAIGDLADLVAELSLKVDGLQDRVDVLHAQVDDITHLLLRLEREDRNRRRERR